MDFSRRDFRVMIYYDWNFNVTAEQCHERIQMIAGERAPSLSTVRNWYRLFRFGRTSLEDESREGRPSTAVIPENIDAVRSMIEQDRHCTYREIQSCLGISLTSIQTILHDHLSVRKLSCRWIPHILTAAEKETRVMWCKEMLRRFKGGQSNAVFDIVTGDETWIYCYEPEKKESSKEWVFPGEANPTKLKRGRSVGKQMVASFFSRIGHIATVALPFDTTLNAEWYTTVCLPEVIRKVRENRSRSRIILHHDNASSHIAGRTTKYLEGEGVELLNPPTYSPDLAPCDFFLFPRIKDKMRGLRFSSAEAAVEAYEKLVSEVSREDWSWCFREWFRRMEECVELKGVYFEK